MIEYPTAPLPPVGVPFLDERTGQLSREWHLFFLNFYARVGSVENVAKLVSGMELDPAFTDVSQPISQDVEAQSPESLIAEIAGLKKDIAGLQSVPRMEQDGVFPHALFGDSVNSTTFEYTGHQVMKGAAAVWVDLDFPIIIRTTGVGIPTLSAILGNITAPQWQVDDVNVCEGQELPHFWKEGSTLYFHVHVLTNGLDTSNRFVSWEIEAAYGVRDNVLTSIPLVSSGDITIPANTPSKTHIMMIVGSVPLPAATIGTHVWARLKRVASVGAAPTNGPWCSMLQAHIECDSLGSRQISSK